MKKKKLIVLTGAGISAESGLKTFRDADGLWEGHRVEDVATPQAFQKNPDLVHDFYNQRRRQLQEVGPNAAHTSLADLESDFEVTIITQNVDDLHERAGSSHIVHLHGELTKVRSLVNPHQILEWKEDLTTTHRGPDGHALRPHIVWFGEDVPLIQTAAELVSEADLLVIIGTSMLVYPAAGLVQFAPLGIPIYYIDPNPTINYELKRIPNLTVIPEVATEGVKRLAERLKDDM